MSAQAGKREVGSATWGPFTGFITQLRLDVENLTEDII